MSTPVQYQADEFDMPRDDECMAIDYTAAATVRIALRGRNAAGLAWDWTKTYITFFAEGADLYYVLGDAVTVVDPAARSAAPLTDPITPNAGMHLAVGTTISRWVQGDKTHLCVIGAGNGTVRLHRSAPIAKSIGGQLV